MWCFPKLCNVMWCDVRLCHVAYTVKCNNLVQNMPVDQQFNWVLHIGCLNAPSKNRDPQPESQASAVMLRAFCASFCDRNQRWKCAPITSPGSAQNRGPAGVDIHIIYIYIYIDMYTVYIHIYIYMFRCFDFFYHKNVAWNGYFEHIPNILVMIFRMFHWLGDVSVFSFPPLSRTTGKKQIQICFELLNTHSSSKNASLPEILTF